MQNHGGTEGWANLLEQIDLLAARGVATVHPVDVAHERGRLVEARQAFDSAMQLVEAASGRAALACEERDEARRAAERRDLDRQADLEAVHQALDAAGASRDLPGTPAGQKPAVVDRIAELGARHRRFAAAVTDTRKMLEEERQQHHTWLGRKVRATDEAHALLDSAGVPRTSQDPDPAGLGVVDRIGLLAKRLRAAEAALPGGWESIPSGMVGWALRGAGNTLSGCSSSAEQLMRDLQMAGNAMIRRHMKVAAAATGGAVADGGGSNDEQRQAQGGAS
ncbi:MAG: hypothetical protein JNK15_02995 [Planctomycetes bacterium]|nr:hypothetical protein [Planctomycetota bacterium]